MKTIAIKIENLSYSYPNGFEALKAINLEIEKNEFVAIIGQNGAGKSTLLKNLIGLEKPTVGNVFICEENTKKISVSKLATKVGFVLQNPDRQLFADTVEEEIMFGLRNIGLAEDECRERMEMAMEQTGILPYRHSFPPALSAGDRAKVVIASVIAMKPEIIILDEPTTGQDKRGCTQIMEIAQLFHQEGHTVIVVTHNMSLVAKYASRCIVFCEGGILIDGKVDDVFGQEDILKKSCIMPPQLTRLATHLRDDLGIKKTLVSVDELGDIIETRINQLHNSLQGDF